MTFLRYTQLFHPEHLGPVPLIGSAADREYFEETGRSYRVRQSTRDEFRSVDRDIPIIFHRSTGLVICTAVQRLTPNLCTQVLGALRLDTMPDRRCKAIFDEWSGAGRRRP